METKYRAGSTRLFIGQNHLFRKRLRRYLGLVRKGVPENRSHGSIKYHGGMIVSELPVKNYSDIDYHESKRIYNECSGTF